MFSPKLANALDALFAHDVEKRRRLQELLEHARLCRCVARVADLMGPDAPEDVLYVAALRLSERAA